MSFQSFSDVKHLFFTSKKEKTTYLILELWIFLNLLTNNNSQKKYSNNFKRLHKHEMFGLSTNFVSNQSSVSSATGTYPIKTPSGQRIQWLSNSYRFPIFENVENLTTFFGISKVSKKFFFHYFGVIVAMFLQNCVYLPNKYLDRQRIHSLLVECFHRSDAWFLLKI